MVLAQAVLHIWTAYGGLKSPSAIDIAMYFEDQNEWSRVMEEQWNRIGLGLPFSPRLMDASEAFYSSCSRRLILWGPTIAFDNASRALQPAEALKQARLRHLAWVTTIPDKDPVEVRSRRQDRLPRTAVPSKMKPELPGFTPHEAFMLQVAVEAKAFSGHQPILLHQAGKGYSEHFDTTWKNMMGNLQPTALEHCVLAWRRWRAHTKESPHSGRGERWTKRSSRRRTGPWPTT